MENFLYFLRIMGIACVGSGILAIVVSFLWNRIQAGRKSRRIFQKILKNALSEGEYDIEDAKVIIKENDGVLESKISFPTKMMSEKKIAHFSFHCFLMGAILFVGGTLKWFDDMPAVWFLLLSVSFYAPLVLIKLLSIVIFIVTLLYDVLKLCFYHICYGVLYMFCFLFFKAFLLCLKVKALFG